MRPLASLAVLAALAVLAERPSALQVHQAQRGLEVAWDTSFGQELVDGLVTGASVVSGNRVYTALNRPSGVGFLLRARDASSGAFLWQVPYKSPGAILEGAADMVISEDGRDLFIVAGSGFSGSSFAMPVLRMRASDGSATVLDSVPGTIGRRVALSPDGSRVYAFGDMNGLAILVAYDVKTGERLWDATMAGTSSPGPTGLVAGGDLVHVSYTSASGSIVVEARMAGSGEQVFERDPGLFGSNQLERANGLVVLNGATLAVGGVVVALSEKDGTQAWIRGTGTVPAIALSPDGSRVYRAGVMAAPFQPAQVTIEALDFSTGSMLWSAQRAGIGYSELAVSDDGSQVAIDVLGFTGGVTNVALDSSTGAGLWDSSGGRAIGNLAFGAQDSVIVSSAISAMQGSAQTGVVAETRDASTGTVVWMDTAFAPGNATEIATAAALSHDGRDLFIAGYHTDSNLTPNGAVVVALDPGDGSVGWVHDDPGAVAVSEVVCNPASDAVHVRAPGRIFSLDAADGTELWSRDFQGLSDLDVAPSGERLYLARRFNQNIALVGLDPQAGTNLWFTAYDPGGKADDPVAIAASPNGEWVYVTGQATVKDAAGVNKKHVVTAAFDAETGAFLWEVFQLFGTNYTGLDIVVSPAGDVVYTAAGQHDMGQFTRGRVIAHDAATGAELWTSQNIPNVALSQLVVSADGSRVAGQGTRDPQFADPFSMVACYDAVNGTQIWNVDFGQGPKAGVASIAMTADGRTVVGTGATNIVGLGGANFLTIAFDIETGAEVWRGSRNGSADLGDQASAIVVSRDKREFFVVGTTEVGQQLFDLAALGYRMPTFVSVDAEVSLSLGGQPEFELRAGRGRAGSVYWVLGSASGTSPGIVLPGGIGLPLVDDGYFRATLEPLSGPFVNFLGFLDGEGAASASIAVPANTDPWAVGLTLHHAYLVLNEKDGVIHASNPLDLELKP